MDKDIKELMLSFGVRGIMTLLGFRKTTGSQDVEWPTKLSLLE
jgi:hypothetical protein